MSTAVTYVKDHSAPSSKFLARRGAFLCQIAISLVALKLLSSALLTDDEEGVASAFAMIPKAIDAVLLCVAMLGVAIAPSTKKKWRLVGAAAAHAIVVLFSQVIVDRSVVDAFATLAKFLTPFLIVAAVVLNKADGGGMPSFKYVAWWVCVLTIVGLFYVEPTFRNGAEWLPAYFSGTHTSAYVSIMSVAMLFAYFGKNVTKSPSALPVALALYMVFIGWGVRTASVGVGVALGFVLFRQAGPRIKASLVLLLITALTTVGLVLLFDGLQSTFQFEEMSSGRTSVWVERITNVTDRSLVQVLLGTGVGSDLSYSEVWWWDLKNSHNDFLSIAVEQGIVGLALSLSVLWFTFKLARPNTAWIAIWLMFILTSLLSNGIMFRPTASVMFALALIAAYRGSLAPKSHAT